MHRGAEGSGGRGGEVTSPVYLPSESGGAREKPIPVSREASALISAIRNRVVERPKQVARTKGLAHERAVRRRDALAEGRFDLLPTHEDKGDLRAPGQSVVEDLDPAPGRNHHVEQNRIEIGSALGQILPGRIAIIDGEHIVARLNQHTRQKPQDMTFIVNEENLEPHTSDEHTEYR